MRKLLLVVALLGLVACGDDGDDPTVVSTTTSEVAAQTTTTAVAFGNTDVSTPEATEQGELTDVTVGAHDGFVRVVFTFSNLVPGYSVKKASPPFTQDGSGAAVQVGGSGHLAVRLTARAHDEEGKPTVENKRIVGPNRTSLVEVVPVGDFEGVVGYVIGTTEPKGFKVFTLKSPARLVVDIES